MKYLGIDEIVEAIVMDVPLELRLRALTAEERLKGLSPQERLKGLSPEERAQLLELLQQAKKPKTDR